MGFERYCGHLGDGEGFPIFLLFPPRGLYKDFCGGPWVIGKATLALKKWSLNLDLNDLFFVQAPVWVRLPKLPLKFWYEDIFKGIVGSFGELLSIDPVLVSRKRLT